MSDFIQKLFSSYKERTDGDTRIGEHNRIWYDSINNVFRIQLDNTPGGTIIGGGSGGGSDYTLPTASTTVKGGVKIDGTTITINNQVISGFSGSYTDLTNKPTIPSAQVNSDWTASSGVAQILNKPTLFSGSYTDLTNKPTIPAAQIQSDWTQSNNASLDYIKNKPTIPDITDIEDALAATGEPMGHKDRSQSVISFDDASRTFSISPVSGSFEIWTKGVKRTITDTRTVTIPDTTGLYYIYFDTNGTLQQKTTVFDWPNDCITAYVYWNDVTNKAPFVADERHGITLDWQTHEYLHRTRGAAIANGFGATNYIVGADGSLDAHMQLDIASGTFFDEDLQVDIVNTNTPVANTWDQDLSGPAKIPMFYINSGGGWVMDEPTNFPIKQGTLPKYNLYSGGVWTTPDIDNNKFGITFIIATNNINYPVIGIIGQASHANIGAAEATEFSDLNLAGFPVVEMRPLYKLVYECKNSYTNSVNARLMSVWDQRGFASVASAIASYTDHGALGGLGDDDHPQYLLRTEAPTIYSSTYIGTTSLDFTRESASQTLTGVSIDGSVVWTNPSPAPATPWRTTINAASGNANIVLYSGLPGIGSEVTWTFDEDKIKFPDNTVQTTAFTGSSTVDANDLTGTTLASGVTASSLTSLGSLTGLTVGGTGGDLTMTGGAITGVGNITATGILAVNASGGITTTQTSFDIVNSTATTVNIGGAATAVNIGATTGTLTLNNPTVVGTQTTQAVFDTVATTVTAFRAATTLTIGATSGTLTLRNTTIVGSQSSLTLFNTVATTVNAFGAATTLNLGASTGTTTVNNNLSMASGKTIGTTGTITSNHTTAFVAGDNAISNVALQIPQEGAIRNLYNGAANNMYFDVSIGGTSQGQFQFRSSSSFTNVLTMSPTAFNVNPEAVVTAKTASFGRLPWNSAIDTELTIDDYRWRITNSGGIYAQVISNTGGTKNSAWTAVAAISGQAVAQGGSTGILLPNNSWTTLYTFGSMASAGDTVTVTFQDKVAGRIYRITFMRSDNGSTTGYNIIAERLL